MPAKTIKTSSMTVRLEEGFHRRLMAKLNAEGIRFQTKVQTMLEEYVDGPAEGREELARRVALARETMRRYEPALRELAR